MSTGKRYFNLMVICLGAGAIFKLAYLRDVYYTPLQEALGVSNTQMGLLITFFAITQMIAYLPGGWLVDYIPVKYVMPVGLITTGLLGFWEATYPSFTCILIIQMGYGITITLFFWDAMIKATRMLADEGGQGKMFGLQEGLRGLCATLVSFIGLYFFNGFGEGPEGLQKTIIFYSVWLVAAGILTFFLMDKDEVEGKVDARGALQGMIGVLKMPKVWLAAAIVFFGYSFYNGLSFMSPMLIEQFGMSETVASGISIVRQYGIAIFAAPLGGIIADKMGSRVRFLRVIMIFGAAATAVFLVVPYGNSTVVIGIAVMIMIAIAIFMMRGTYYSTSSELGVSVATAGAVAGVMSLLGNMPDFYIFTVYGNMLDRFQGAAGYKAIFIIMIAHAIGAAICAAILYRQLKSEKKRAA